MVHELRMFVSSDARLGLVLSRHPKKPYFVYTTVLFVVKWRQNVLITKLNFNKST